jgi:AcrR family transcriptional regulator
VPEIDLSRRADAERNVWAILDAAVRVLGDKPDASMGEVAAAAGVTRQTVYAHYRTRDALLAAVLDHAMKTTLMAFAGARLDEGPPAEALDRLVASWWGSVRRHARILGTLGEGHPGVDRHAFHAPVLERLAAFVERGRRAKAFARDVPVAWQTAAFLGLVHTAAEEVAAGRLTEDQAGEALATTVPRVFGVASG